MLTLRKFSFRSFDWTLLISVLLLMAMGIAAIYSVDLSRGEGLLFFKKQLIALSIGMALLLVASVTQYTFFRSYAKLFYLLAVLLLIAVLLFGNSIRGTKGWFGFGGFSFQPVEAAVVFFWHRCHDAFCHGTGYVPARFGFGYAARSSVAWYYAARASA